MIRVERDLVAQVENTVFYFIMVRLIIESWRIFSCRTESAAALETTFRTYVRPFSKCLSIKSLKNSASTDLVGGMWPAYGQHVASMSKHVASILPTCRIL